MCKRKKKKEKGVTYFGSSEVGVSTSSSVRGLNPFLSVGTLNFGFVQALVRIHSLLFAGIFLPLITVVYPGTAQQTGQLIQSLGVVFDQFCYGTEFRLAFLR